MMNYGTIESPMVDECEVRPTVKKDIQETFACLCEMQCVLNDFMSIMFGNRMSEKDDKNNASCLSEEARMMVALAHENMKKLMEIKNGIV